MKLFYVFTLVLLLSCGCSHSPITAELDKAEQLITDKPDSAELILKSIKRSELKNRALKARFALLYSQAMDKCYIDTDNDSLISVAVKYYSKRGSDHEKALAYYYESVVYKNAKDIDAQVKSLIKAQEFGEKTNNAYLKGLIYNKLGQLYHAQKQFDEALSNFDIAVTCFRELDLKQNLLFSLQYKGISQNMLNMYDEAIPTLYNARDLAIETNNIEILLNIFQNIYFIKIDNSDIHDIHKIKEEFYEVYNKYNNGNIPTYHYPLWANIHMKLGDYNTAKQYITKSIEYFDTLTKKSVGGHYRLAQIEHKLNNDNEAYNSLKKYINLKDSLDTEKQKSLVQSLEQKYKAKYLKESLEHLQKQHRMTNTIYALSVILVLIAGVFTFRRYRHAAKERARKIEELEQYIEQSSSKYAELQEKYNTIAKGIEQLDKSKNQQSSRVLDVLKNRIESLHKLSDLAATYGVTNTSKFYNKFQEHIRLSNNKNQELMADVITIADLLNCGVISYLRKCHPSLTDYELCYCAFITLGFGTEAIRLLFNHSNINSIYTTRAKIRNKLGISNTIGTSLEGYIEEMCQELKSAEIEGGGV